METITISKEEYIELLEISLYAKQEAHDKDSSWNYGIEELREKIEKLKNS